MGTNYYLVTGDGDDDYCDHCKRGTRRRRHIGKASGGWHFALHVYPDEGINTLDDWKVLLAADGAVVDDEYSDVISGEAMLSIITERSRGAPNTWTEERYRQNFAEPGLNGLVRAALGHGCIGHGEGTWDYIEGNFS